MLRAHSGHSSKPMLFFHSWQLNKKLKDLKSFGMRWRQIVLALVASVVSVGSLSCAGVSSNGNGGSGLIGLVGVTCVDKRADRVH